MTISSNTTPVTSPDNDELPSQSPRRSGNVQWILGVAGGAISGLFIGASIYHPDSRNTLLVGLIIFIYLAIGITVGSLVPRVGCLAGLGAIIGITVGSIALAHSASLKYTVPGQNDDYIQRFYWIFPLAGGIIGLFWHTIAWVRRRRTPGQSLPSDGKATVATRQDRIRLAWTSLLVGVGLGFGCGVLIGGPFFIAGPILGAIAGGAVFVILAISAYLSTIFK